jgi:hypothetical protein
MLKTAIPFVKAAGGVLLLAAVLFSRASEAAPPVEPKLGDYWARYFIACETYKAAKERLRATFAELLLPGSPPFHERVKYEVWYPEFRELRRKANVLAGMLPGLKNACEQSKATYEQALQTYVNAALEDLMSSPPTAAAPPRSTRSPTTTKKPPTGTTRRPPTQDRATAQALTGIILFGLQQGLQSQTYGTRSGTRGHTHGHTHGGTRRRLY